MGFWSKIAGTLEDWFSLNDEDVAIGNDGSGNMVFKDRAISGTKTLTQLLEGEEGFNPDRLIITTDGGLVYDSEGIIVIKENP